MIGSCCSFYHFPARVGLVYEPEHLDEIYIFNRSDLKNYDGEIAAFLDWVMPYIDEPEGTWIGHVFYEEWEQPEPVFKTAAE